MSSYQQVQKIIREITDDVYPGIEVLFQEIKTLKKSLEDTEHLDVAFDIFDGLKAEVQSLKNYELKLVFPGVEKYYGEMERVLPQHIRINELHDLLRKKEECVKDKIIDLEVEIEENGEATVLNELVTFFKDNYFCRKDAFYRCIAKLQKERTASGDKDVIVEDSLPA